MTAATQVATCPDCGRKASREGYCRHHARARYRREEIEFLRSFGTSDERIADRLGIKWSSWVQAERRAQRERVPA